MNEWNTHKKAEEKMTWDLFTNGLTRFNSFMRGFYIIIVANFSLFYKSLYDDGRFYDDDDDDDNSNDDDDDMQNGRKTTIYI